MAKIHLKNTLFTQQLNRVKNTPLFKNININKVLLKRFIQLIQLIFILMIIIHIVTTIWQHITFSPKTKQETLKANNKLVNKSLYLSPQEWQLLQKQNWFGEYKQEVKTQPKVVDNPIEETSLKITLRGISYGTRPSAVIEEDGKQNVYQKGDLLTNGSTTIKDVCDTHILLDSNGKIEKLSLIDEDSTAEIGKMPHINRGAIVSTSNNNVASELPDELLKSLRKKPQKIFDYIQLVPYRKNDVIGYEIKPGKDRTLFDLYGFKLGDIVTSVNNNDITNKRQLMMLMRQLPTMDSVQLTMMRNNIRQIITIKLR